MNKNIISSNITRWNSEFILVRSILSIEKDDIESITGLMKNLIRLTNKDRSISNKIINVPEPFHDISIKCQAEDVVTGSLVVPAVVHLLVHLRDMKPAVLFCKGFIEKLVSSIEESFAGIVKRLNQMPVQEHDPFNDPLYFMSTVLDPAFKFYWLQDLNLPTSTENLFKQHIVQLILDEISKNTTLSTAGAAAVPSSPFSSSTVPYKRRKLFSYHDNDRSNSSSTIDPAAELDLYLSDPIKSKFSEYWLHSKRNFFKKLVFRLFSVQASSAPIERIFSSAGIIFSARRRKIGEQIFKDSVFLKANQCLL